MPAYTLLLYRFADVMRLAALGNQEHDWEVNMDEGMWHFRSYGNCA